MCVTCGKEHDTDEISLGAFEPVQWHLITEDERSRSALGEDQCEIDSSEGQSFYIRGCLEIPVKNSEMRFTWGVWCSLSEKNYAEMIEHWTDPQRMLLGPYFGWLCTKIPEYPDTVYLKTMVHQREVGTRPLIKLEATDHPLAIDQLAGIEEERLQRIIGKLLH
ncbi:MAG: DUF2199 domain-containing protein [Opitutaceae bacterium]